MDPCPKLGPRFSFYYLEKSMITDKQEIFNTIWEKFVVNKAPRAYIESLGCRYRTADGSKCFVGCLISDEEYDGEMETKTIGDIFEDLNPKWLPVDLVPFLRELQAIHDSISMFNSLKENLRKFAQDHCLTVP